jgi:zinc transporter, ZIP family
MEARATSERPPFAARAPAWALGLIPLSLIAGAAALLALLGAPGLGDRTGPPVEELAIERTVLRPGEIQLTVRNDGPDAVDVAQVVVNDAFVPFTASDGQHVGRLGSTTFGIAYPWIEGEAYEISLLTSTGATIEHQIPVAAETPEASTSFFALMALLGLYVGVIPVALGMLWLPFVRRISEGWIRLLIAFTVGLLAVLGVDAGLEGLQIGGAAPSVFGGQALVLLGALVAYLALSGVDSHLSARQARSASASPAAQPRASARGNAARGGTYLALLVAIGIGLHNLGEGLAIGSAYAVGALALGTFLVIGFALHNTTEGLAIVAPLAEGAPSLRRLGALGLIAGAPAIPGAWIGFAAFNPSIAALLFGVGVGAIARVVWQLVPAMRDDQGRALYPGTVAGLVAGMLALYVTGLLVPV